MSEDDGPRSSGGHPHDGVRSDGDVRSGDGGTEDVRSGDVRSGDGGAEDGETGPLRRVRTATDGPLMVLRETAVSVAAVAAVGLLLFAISGVWPPMVAVESGSMEPHMQRGDLVFMTEPGRFADGAARDGTGVVTRETGTQVDHWKFGGSGSVIVYDNPGSAGPPVIHRAQFWVAEGENWYDRADPAHVSADDCASMQNCPAPNAGFVTKGDANGRYDQVNGISEPVKPAWIVGVARVRIPYLGWVRLGVSGVTSPTPAVIVLDAVPETTPEHVLDATSGTTPEPVSDVTQEERPERGLDASATAGTSSPGDERMTPTRPATNA